MYFFSFVHLIFTMTNNEKILKIFFSLFFSIVVEEKSKCLCWIEKKIDQIFQSQRLYVIHLRDFLDANDDDDDDDRTWKKNHNMKIINITHTHTEKTIVFFFSLSDYWIKKKNSFDFHIIFFPVVCCYIVLFFIRSFVNLIVKQKVFNDKDFSSFFLFSWWWRISFFFWCKDFHFDSQRKFQVFFSFVRFFLVDCNVPVCVCESWILF